MFTQVSSFLDNLSKQQCGLRQGFSTQQCLLALLEKWDGAVNSDEVFGALLSDWLQNSTFTVFAYQL